MVAEMKSGVWRVKDKVEEISQRLGNKRRRWRRGNEKKED